MKFQKGYKGQVTKNLNIFRTSRNLGNNNLFLLY